MEWLYFGCHRQAGHYVFGEGMRKRAQRFGSRDLSRLDGMLPPQTDTTPYVATVSRLEGWGISALAFWDYSVDKSRGCNSVVFAPSLTIDPDELLAEAQKRFPEVFGRLPQPVKLLSSNALAQADAACGASTRSAPGSTSRGTANKSPSSRPAMNDQEFLEAKVGGLEASLQALQQTHWDNYFAAAIRNGDWREYL